MLEYLPQIVAGLQLLGQGKAAQNVARGYVPTAAEGYQIGALGAQGGALGLQGQQLSNQNRLIQAFLNPNDVITKNIEAGEKQQLNSATQQALSNLLSANRRAQLMGRTSYFNPERQDESISQFLTKQADSNANTARSNALTRILSTIQNYGTNASEYASNATGYGGNASGYGGQVTNQQNAQNVNNQAAPTALGGLADILKQFGSGGSMSNIFSSLGGGSSGGGVKDLGTSMPWLTSAAGA